MNKKIKKYKVGAESETYAISMVEMPAIEENFVALAKQEEEKVFLSKDEKHMVYGAVLVPDKDIYRNNGEQEFYISFTKESIEKMSQEFMKEYRQHEVTLDHEDTANEVCVVESWLKSDMYKDKSLALGLNENLPIGTWFCGMKVNNIETWERIKTGELKGFSVESMISLEEFGKQNDNNMNIETNEIMFWDKMKNILTEVFSSLSMNERKKDEEAMTIEELAATSGFTNVEDYQREVEAIKQELEEQTQAEEAPKVEETVVEEAPKVEEPTVEEPKPQDTVEEKPKEDITKLEELIGNLKNEIEALKTMNSGLEEKVKEMSKQPSVEPVKPNAKPSASDTYSAWREQMRSMIG